MILLLVDGPIPDIFAVFQCFFSQMYLERQIDMAIKHPLFVDVFRNPAQQVLRKWPDPLYPASRKWTHFKTVSTKNPADGFNPFEKNHEPKMDIFPR